MQVLVSICVPVYNVAPYIERCVHSLMQQTYENIEYIFVDDCSTDESVSLLQKVIADNPNRAKQVRILHNDRNHGTAFTRKRGIEQSSGKYITCVDGDDSLPYNAIELLLQKAASSEADVVCGVAKIIKQGRQTVEEAYTPTGKPYLDDFLLDYFPRANWGKLYERSLLLSAVTIAPEGMIYSEDRLASLYVCAHAKKIDSIQDVVYCYYNHANSNSTTRTKIQFENLMLFWQHVDQYLDEHQLTDTYRIVTDRKKIEDKVHLLHFCNDLSVCRKYADMFPEAETQQPTLHLTRGLRITRFLTYNHLWILLYFYKKYVKFSLLFA